MRFAEFVGNQSVIAEAKRGFAASRMTLVVASPTCGRSSFVSCLEDHFRSSLRFVYPHLDEGDLKSVLRAHSTRKAGVMEAFSQGVEYAPDKRGLRIVLDDIDPSERNLVATLEETLKDCDRSVGIVIVTDPPGLRKLSLLKKKGALVLLIAAPGKDAVTRWARRRFLPDGATEDDHERLRSMLKACRLSIYRLERAYEENLTPKEAAATAPEASQQACDNTTTLVQLYTRPASSRELLEAVGYEGGSMLGQLAWHNAPHVFPDDRDYVVALAASLDGMVIERSAHLKHSSEMSALGHALSLAPYSGKIAKLDRCCISYTTTMAQGGARAVARRALTSMTDDRSVSERAWEAAHKKKT